jgi:hypothetical protein
MWRSKLAISRRRALRWIFSANRVELTAASPSFIRMTLLTLQPER